MSLGTYAVAEMRNGGSDSNSGFFDATVAGGTDYTLQTAAQVTFTATLSGAGTTTLSDSANGFLAAHAGNSVRATGIAIGGTFSATGTTTLTCSASNFIAAHVGMIISVNGSLALIKSQAGTTAVLDRGWEHFLVLAQRFKGCIKLPLSLGQAA